MGTTPLTHSATAHAVHAARHCVYGTHRCENCLVRDPLDITVDVTETLKRLGLSRHEVRNRRAPLPPPPARARLSSHSSAWTWRGRGTRR